MYVPIVLAANMIGLNLPINAFNDQLTAVVIEVLFALVLYKLIKECLVYHLAFTSWDISLNNKSMDKDPKIVQKRQHKLPPTN
jgi:hypothetical protein